MARLLRVVDVPDAVRRRALAHGAGSWLAALPAIVAELELEWGIRVGPPLEGGTESFVAHAKLADGEPAVVKLLPPHEQENWRRQAAVLALAAGQGCATLLRCDATRCALLMERLGPSVAELSLPLEQRHVILCTAAARLWRPAPDAELPTGAQKAQWLAGFITATWEELDRPCSTQAVEHALACAERRGDAHDDERAVLVHGDLTQWNCLRSADEFKLIDPDGLLAEPEYDLGVVMREDPIELLSRADPRERARTLARRADLDAQAVWEWGVVERVSTGLLATQIDLQPIGRQMLQTADHLAQASPRP